MLQEPDHIKNIAVLIFGHIQCLYLMNSEVAWVLVSSGTQVQPQIILDSDYLPDFPFLMTMLLLFPNVCLILVKKKEKRKIQ